MPPTIPYFRATYPILFILYHSKDFLTSLRLPPDKLLSTLNLIKFIVTYKVVRIEKRIKWEISYLGRGGFCSEEPKFELELFVV
jgi:hypothetical protein